jgi:hypothetical protein
MNSMKRIIRVGLPALGLVIGILCLGRSLETVLDKDPNRLNKPETITAGLLLGIPCLAGALWLLGAVERDRKLVHSQRLQSLFYKAVRANNGQINPLQFAMLAEIPVEKAKDFLEAWAVSLNADYRIDDTGLMVYRFKVLDVLDVSDVSETNSEPN